MKKILLLLALLTACAPAYSQLMDDGTVQIVGYWSRGDKYDYDFTSTKSRIIDSDTTVLSTSTERVIFEVVDSTATSYTLRMTFKHIHSSNEMQQLINELANEAIADLDYEVLLQTNELGTFEKIANFDEFVAANLKSAEIMIPALYEQVSKDQQQPIPYDRFADMMKGMICDPVVISNIISEYTGMFFAYHGSSMRIGHEYSVESRLDGAFGGSAPTTFYFWVDRDLTDAKTAVIYSYNEMDAKNVAAKTMDNMMQALGTTEGVSDNTFASALEKFEVKLEDYTTVEVHLDSGWPLYIATTRDVIVTGEEGGSRIITQKATTMTLVSEE